jgi:hypothetical protein
VNECENRKKVLLIKSTKVIYVGVRHWQSLLFEFSSRTQKTPDLCFAETWLNSCPLEIRQLPSSLAKVEQKE